MASPDNILFYLAKEQEKQIHQMFFQLAQLGYPQQLQTPHVTVTFSPKMPAKVVDLAAELLPPLIPAQLQRVGTVVFGTKRKQTVAWLLEASDELEIAARRISALNPDGRGPRWIPHLTVGLRLPRELVPDYLRALEELSAAEPLLRTLTADRAGFWRPRTQELTVLAEK